MIFLNLFVCECTCVHAVLVFVSAYVVWRTVTLVLFIFFIFLVVRFHTGLWLV